MKFDDLPASCKTSPLLSRIVSSSLARNHASKASLLTAVASDANLSVDKYVFQYMIGFSKETRSDFTMTIFVNQLLYKQLFIHLISINVKVSVYGIGYRACCKGIDFREIHNVLMAYRCLRLVFREMDEDLLMALLYLSVFPLSFDVAGAAEVLSMPLLHSRAAAVLNTLHARGLLEYHGPQERYWLHPIVKAVVVGIAADLGFSCNTARCSIPTYFGPQTIPMSSFDRNRPCLPQYMHHCDARRSMCYCVEYNSHAGAQLI